MTNRDRYPHLNDKMIAQMDDYDRRVQSGEIPWHSDDNYDHGHMAGQTHPEVWMTGNALSIFTERPSAPVDYDTSHFGSALPRYKSRPTTYPNGR